MMMRRLGSRLMRALVALTLLVALAAPIAACGQKSALVPPEGSKHPRKYPTQ